MTASTTTLSDSIRNVSFPTVLIAIGILLFVVPEPITSIIGAIVVLAGIAGVLVSKLL